MKTAAKKISPDDNSILDWAQDNLGTHAESVQGISFSVTTLYAQNRFVDVLEFVEELQGSGSTSPENHRLYQSLLVLSEILHHVAVSAVMVEQETRALAIADKLIEIAESAKDFREKQIGRYFKALIYFFAHRNPKASMEIFEGIRSDLESSDSDTQDLKGTEF